MAILIEFWYVFLDTDYPILNKSPELCLFMQTVVPHENRVDSFFRLIPSAEIINLT